MVFFCNVILEYRINLKRGKLLYHFLDFYFKYSAHLAAVEFQFVAFPSAQCGSRKSYLWWFSDWLICNKYVSVE